MEKNAQWAMSDYNYVDAVRSQMKLPKTVRINEVTLREGEQMLGVAFTNDEKVRIAKELDELGVDEIEFGQFRARSQFDLVREVSKLGLRADLMGQGFSATVKNWRSIIDEGISAGITIVSITHSSPVRAHTARGWEGNPQATEDDWVKTGVEAVKYAKSKGVKVGVSITGATRTSLASIKRLFRAVVDAGTDRIKICDSAGCCGTAGWRYLVREVKREFPNTPLQVHTHDDLGVATANALASVEEGAEIVDACVNGLGDRAGNANLAEVAVALKALYGVNSEIKLEKLRSTSLLISDLSRFPIPSNKPLVGEWAFSNGLDGHVNAYMWGVETGDPFSQNIIKPEAVGNKTLIELSAWSGPVIVKAKAREWEITVPDNIVSEVARRAQDEVKLRKRVLNEEEFRQIVDSVSNKYSSA